MTHKPKESACNNQGCNCSKEELTANGGQCKNMKVISWEESKESEWEKEFDEQFGISVEESDGYEVSKGRWAGCDDCKGNHALRKEHKEFVRQTLEAHKREVIEIIRSHKVEQQNGAMYITDNRLNGVLEDIINSLTPTEEKGVDKNGG